MNPNEYWLKDNDRLSLAEKCNFKVRKGYCDDKGNPIDKEGKRVDLEKKLGKKVMNLDDFY